MKAFTVQSLIENNNLTPSELSVVNFLGKELAGNFGEMYSHLDCSDISTELKIPVESVKGVVGSLCKKNILDSYPMEGNRGREVFIICFKDQDCMVKA